MRCDNRIHDTPHTPEPNLFDFVPKNVWREVYRGHWNELRPVQKPEFVVELAFFPLLIGCVVYNAYIQGNVLNMVVSFGVVWLLLGAFFVLYHPGP